MGGILDICFLNGEYSDINSAKISVLDRGFIFGDAVYEVIPIYDGIVFGLEMHLQRLNRSLAAIRLEYTQSTDWWRERIYSLIQHNGGGAQVLYLQISRGAAPRAHEITEKASPTLFMFVTRPSESSSNGAAITAEDIRWDRCDIKSTSLLANVLLKTHAQDSGVMETLLFRGDLLTEGAASNVFVVIDNKICTPLANDYILAGVTRGLLIEALTANKTEILERDVSRAQFNEASEIWITSSSRDLVSITICDGKDVGNGEVGEVFKQAKSQYDELKKNLLEQEKAFLL
ncbi:MAG: aminotransferase class IV [Pseudomonadota bacterium]